MPRKTYTEQFKRDAVSLYESTPGATLNAIASDLGVNRNSLRTSAKLSPMIVETFL